jgi:O-antigen/teichoic acid export membrane protein
VRAGIHIEESSGVSVVTMAAPAQARPHASSLIRDARFLSFSQIIRRLFRMAALFLAARFLGPRTFGSYAVLLTIVEMVATLSGSGYIDYLAREIARRPAAGWKMGIRIVQLRIAYGVVCVGFGLGLLLLFRFPRELLGNVIFLSVTLLPRAVNESAQGVLRGLRRFSALPWIEFVQGLTMVAMVTLAGVRNSGLTGILLAEIVAACSGAVLAVLALSRAGLPSRQQGIQFGTIFRATVPFNIYPLIVNAYDRLDTLLLSRLTGMAAAGIYSIPYRAYASLQIIPFGLMGALLPVISREDQQSSAADSCARVMRFLYPIALLTVLGSASFARPAVLFLLGPQYAGSATAMNILAWATVPMFLNYAVNTLLLAGSREKVFLWTASVCFFFNLAANLYFIPRFSFRAAAVVTVLTELLLFAQNAYLVKRFLGRLVLPQDGVRITLGFAAAWTVMLLLSHFIDPASGGALAIAGFALFAFFTVTSISQVRALWSYQP